MGWDYSELSHLAKQNGGPAELLEKHAAAHFKKGADSKNPIIAVASLASLFIGIVGTKLYSKWKNKKNQITVTESEIQEIENELIEGMESANELEMTHESNQEGVNQFLPPEDDNDIGNLDISN